MGEEAKNGCTFGKEGCLCTSLCLIDWLAQVLEVLEDAEPGLKESVAARLGSSMKGAGVLLQSVQAISQAAA